MSEENKSEYGETEKKTDDSTNTSLESSDKREYGETEKKTDSSETNVEYKTDPTTGETYYQDPKTKMEYTWDAEKNSWKERVKYDFDGKTYLYTGKFAKKVLVLVST